MSLTSALTAEPSGAVRKTAGTPFGTMPDTPSMAWSGPAHMVTDAARTRLVDDPQPHGLALLWPALGERSLHDRAQLTERGEVLDPRLLVEVELRRLNAEPPRARRSA